MTGTTDPQSPAAPRPVETPWGVLAVLGALVVGLAALAVFWNSRQTDAAWEAAGSSISAVADLKLEQLLQWRAERMADAHTIRESPNAVRGLEALVTGRTGAADSGRVRDWMRALARRNGYERVVLVDRAGRAVLSSAGEGRPLDEETGRAVLAAFAAGAVQMGDIHRSGTGAEARIDVVAPLPSSRAGGGSFGAVVLEVDPRAVLFPRLESWPVPSASGEVLLLSLANDEFTFLSDTRGRPGSSLTLRRPMSAMRPGVREALERGGGLVVQEDYRGVPVLAATRRVPGSSWILTAKMDVVEIRGPQRQRAVLLSSVVALFTLGCGVAVLAIWRIRTARHYQQLYQAEAERRAIERRYEVLTRYANDMVFIVDERLRFVEANERAVEAYGYPREELLRLGIPDLRSPEALSDVDRDLRGVSLHGGALYESVHRRADGSTFPVEVSARLIDLDGRRFMLSIVRDASERKRHERRIADLNRLYAVLSRINEAILRTRDRDALLAETCRVAVEAGSLRLAWVALRDGDDLTPAAMAGGHEDYVANLRLTLRDEPRGRGPTGQAIREDRVVGCADIATDPAMALWRDAALARGLRSFVALPLRLHGRPIGALCLYAGQPRFFDAEEMQLLEEVAADLSYALEVMEQEEQHRRSEAERMRLGTVIEQSSEAVLITDVAGALQYVNPAFERMSGYSKAEVLGRNPRLLKSGRHGEPFYHGLWETLLRGETWHGRMTNRRKDGTLYEQETTISPIRDAAGAVISFVAASRDVSREMALESQLRQAQKMEEMGRLAGGVAHDFNNLLTAIIGSAELVLADLASESPVRSDVENLRRAARRGADLTQKLLAFSRRQPLAVRNVAAGDLVHEFARLVRRILREDVALQVRAELPGPTLLADAGAVEQILMNLVTNARDALLEGGAITIEVGRTELSQDDCDLLRAGAPGEYVILTVSDNGAGMSDETQLRLFEPFFTTKDPGAGTGLGMAMVYGLVQEHRGFLAVDSSAGQGTTVRVYLPAQTAPAPPGAPEAAPALPRGSETLLVVEDEEDLRAFARRALEKHGYVVLLAADGREALDVLRRRGDEVRLVISDMVMPRMGGPQLERAMREAGIAIPVLFTSGYPARNADESRLREAEVSFLAKPWTIGELLRKVRGVLDARGG